MRPIEWLLLLSLQVLQPRLAAASLARTSSRLRPLVTAQFFFPSP